MEAVVKLSNNIKTLIILCSIIAFACIKVLNDTSSMDIIDSKVTNQVEIGQFLFRGIPFGHEFYPQAVDGFAVPFGGKSTPSGHNFGNTQSEYTSWTTNPYVAFQYATTDEFDSKSCGIILVKKINSLNNLHSTPDVYHEKEILFEGKQKADLIIPVCENNKRTLIKQLIENGIHF